MNLKNPSKPSKLREALLKGRMITIRCTEKGEVVEVNWGNIAAMGALLLALSSSVYSLVISPLQEDLKSVHGQLNAHEVRVQALEISDARTGVHLQNLTKSIDKLVQKMEAPNVDQRD